MNGQTYTGIFDQKLALPKTTKKIELSEVILYPTGGLQRTYRTGEITEGTQLAPNVIRLPFPIQSYLSNIMPTGQNRGWAVRDINVTFNPDPQTGLRLDEIFKQGFKVALYDPGNPAQTQDFKHWSWVPNWPITDQYFLRSITYSDGNHIIDPTVPPNGDFWAFRESDLSGTTCSPLSSNGIDIVAIKLFVNESSAGPGSVTNETQVAFMHGTPGIAGHPDLPYWSMLMFNRPNTPDYTIGLTGEAQDGFDARSTPTPSTNINILGSAVDMERINNINCGIEDDKEEPTGLLNLINKPSIPPLHGSYVIPGRFSSQPTGDTKKTIRLE
jgi:hypothetical protein